MPEERDSICSILHDFCWRPLLPEPSTGCLVNAILMRVELATQQRGGLPGTRPKTRGRYTRDVIQAAG
jgi:hypothetical protein